MTADPIVVKHLRRIYDHDERQRRRRKTRELAIELLKQYPVLAPIGAVELAKEQLRGRRS